MEIRRASAVGGGNGHTPSRNKAPVQKHMARHGLLQHDSGNEESDSLHSLYHCTERKCFDFIVQLSKESSNFELCLRRIADLRRDDSSIDSLERELLGDHHHHHHHHSAGIHLRRDKMSVTNLSRDSGLTLSDTQLYTPDEDMEEGSESSSSGRGSDRDKSRNAVVNMRPRTNTTTAATTPTASSRADLGRSMYAVPSSTQRLVDTGVYGKLGSIPSSYTPVYADQRSVLRKLSDDVVYAVPKATPTVVLAEEFVQSQSSSSFQRQDWFRRKSHNRGKSQSGVKFDDDYNEPMPLRRSASDESLANGSEVHYLLHHHHHHQQPLLYSHHQYGMHHSSSAAVKKPAAHRKGRAPAPPRSVMKMDCMELSRRSNSVAQLDNNDGLRLASQDEPDRRNTHLTNGKSSIGHSSMRPSLSTPHINGMAAGDRSYDSSTLSDDDSTPHVSRSNSRGSKDYRAVNSAWESAYGALTVPVPAPIHIIVSQDGTGSIVYNKSGGGGGSGNNSGSTTTTTNGNVSVNGSSSNGVSNARTPSSRVCNNSSSSSSAYSDSRSRHTVQQQHQQQERRQQVPHSAPAGIIAPSVRASAHYCATPPSGRYGDYDTVIYASHGGRRTQPSQQNDPPSGPQSRNGTPDIPSYEETMLIRRCQRQPANNASNCNTGGTTWTTWKDRSVSSSNGHSLIQVRASPVRLNGQLVEPSESVKAPPVPPKTDSIPPLPPKQRIHLRPVKMRLNEHTNGGTPRSPSSRPRPVTIHMDASILSGLDGSAPPSLPRKERRGNNVSVVSIENSYTPLHRSFAFSTHNLRTAMESAAEGKGEEWTTKDEDLDDEAQRRKDQEMQTSGHWAQFCEIETQTSLSPQPSLTTTSSTTVISSSDEASAPVAPTKKQQTVGRYEKNSAASRAKTRREVAVETDRSRPRTRDASSGRDTLVVHRSHSLPPLDKTSSSSDESDAEEEKVTIAKTIGARKKQEVNSSTSQALRRAEISWSVSQLRAIFNGSAAASSSGSTPPPYRSPPAHLQTSQRQRSESADSYGEESYV